MTELDIKYLQEENDKLKREDNALRKNIEKISYRLDECRNENNLLKSKLADLEKVEYRIPDYELERRKLNMENSGLRETVGVLAEEIVRLRKCMRE